MKKSVLIALTATTLLLGACNNNQQKNNDMESTVNKQSEQQIFPKGEVISGAAANNFTGKAWLEMLVTDDATYDCVIGNVTFEPGCRNNWHSHAGGQILLVTSGEGYYQEQGKPIQLIKTGDVVEIRPDVVHWHGATPDSQMVHLAISTKAGSGPVIWGEPVTDEQYNSYQK